MDHGRFRRLCAGVTRLSVAQLRELRTRLRGLDARIELLSRIDARGQTLTRCARCESPSLQRWGQTPRGLRRWRCKDCGPTFSATTGTLLAGVRHPEKLLLVLEDMMSDHPRSCRALARQLGIDKMTVWGWRMRLLRALIGSGAQQLEGIVEADEKFFRESRKGSREWVDHERDPSRHPKPDRPRWRDFRRLRRLFPAGLSRWQIPVLTMTDRAGAHRADVLPDRRASSLTARLEAHVGQDAVLCSDGDSAYEQFAQRRGMPHYRLHPRKGPRVIRKAFHIQNINNLHGRFESFMKPFRGPATKNLPAYAAWFIARLAPSRNDAREQLWRNALAA